MKKESSKLPEESGISDALIAACAANAARRTDGVAALSGTRAEQLAKNLLQRDTAHQGARVSHRGEELSLDVYIVVTYGSNIPSVCWDVQRNVKDSVELLTGRKPAAINVHVQRVKIPLAAEEDLTDE